MEDSVNENPVADETLVADVPSETTTEVVEDVQQEEVVEAADDNIEPEIDSEESSVDYEFTGNETFDTIGSAIAEHGLDPSIYKDEILFQINNGETDIGLSQESFDELTDKFGDKVATLFEKQYLSELQATMKQEAVTKSEVYNAFGGEEAFKGIVRELDKAEAFDAKTKEELAEMLYAGGMQREFAVNKIKETYMDSADFTQVPQLVNEGESQQPQGIEVISRGEYTSSKMEAMAKGDLAAVESLNKRAKYTMENRTELWR